MKTTERDIEKYFRKRAGPIADIIMLRDRHSNKHKGYAYIEFVNLDDIVNAVGCSGKIPNWQSFPILVKPSEAEVSERAFWKTRV